MIYFVTFDLLSLCIHEREMMDENILENPSSLELHREWRQTIYITHVSLQYDAAFFYIHTQTQ